MREPPVVPYIKTILFRALCFCACWCANANAGFSNDQIKPAQDLTPQDRALQQRVERERLLRAQEIQHRELQQRELQARMRRPPIPPMRIMTHEDLQHRIETELTKAQAAYDAIKVKTDNKADCVVALVNLATAIYETGDKDRASQIYKEAYKLYLGITLDPVAESKARAGLWKHIGYLSPDQFDASFTNLLQRSLKTNYDINGMDGHISQAASDRDRTWKSPPFDKRKFYNSTIATISAIKGTNSSELEFPLRSYAEDCEQHNDLDEAEAVLKRVTILNPSQSREKNAVSKVRLEEFYIRHKMYSKAEQYWPTIKNLSTPFHSQWIPSEFQKLAEMYLKDGRPDDAEKILTALIQSGGNNALYAIDRLMEAMVVGQINGGNLERAHKLLSLRIEASKRLSDDRDAYRWYLKLSEVDLAMGKTQESQKLFDRVKIYTALRKGNMDKLLEDRVKLSSRLKK